MDIIDQLTEKDDEKREAKIQKQASKQLFLEEKKQRKEENQKQRKQIREKAIDEVRQKQNAEKDAKVSSTGGLSYF